jgi:3-deoxy-D-manno-octulosonic-acid transferase
MRLLYSIGYCFALPFILARALWRSRQNKEHINRLSERFGFISVPEEYKNGVVFHAVSVGETVVASYLIKQFQTQFPNIPVIVTTTTVTGSDRVRAIFKNSNIFHVYLPYDIPFAMNKFFDETKPKLLVIFETELWPNLMNSAKNHLVHVMLANGRLSEKSLKGYDKIKYFIEKEVLSHFSALAVQTKEDAERYLTIGANKEKLFVVGNMKFDASGFESQFAAGGQLREQIGNRPVFIAASTHQGEEDKILSAFSQIKKSYPNCFLIIVPRHPERFECVRNLISDSKYKYVLRSKNEKITADTDVLLADTMGELMMLYAASDIVFVGGSFAPVGGHNMLEPALFGKAIITGPQLYNFSEIAKQMLKGEGMVVVHNESSLADIVIRFLSDENLMKKYGENAKKIVDANRGSVDKHIKLMEQYL